MNPFIVWESIGYMKIYNENTHIYCYLQIVVVYPLEKEILW